MRLRTSQQVEHRRQLNPTQRAASGHVERDSTELVDLGSNNYLGLLHDERIRQAAIEAIQANGTSASASPVLTGFSPRHAQLTESLCRFKDCGAALIFPCGFSANLAAVTASIQEDSIILCDRLAHASLIDGCRLSGATTRFFKHRDTKQVESLLQRYSDHPIIVIMEGLFSMDGTWAPVDELRSLAERYPFLLIFDEAHSNGIAGIDGRGLLLGESLSEQVPLLHVGTFSKSFASQGGFIAGGQAIVDRVLQLGRSFMFSTALSPPNVAAANQAIEISRTESKHRNRLLHLIEKFREGTAAQGWSILGEPSSPIVSIEVGSAENALNLANQLQDAGIYAPAIRPPTVRPGTCRVRFSLSASLSDEDLQLALDSLQRIRSQWPT